MPQSSWIEPALETLYQSATQASHHALNYLETGDNDSFANLVGYCERIESVDGWWHHIDFAWPQRPGAFIGPVVGNTALSVLAHFARRVRDRELNTGDFSLVNLRRERNIAQSQADADYRELHFVAVAATRTPAKFPANGGREKPPAIPLVVLRGITEKPIVCGQEVDPISKPKYRVVEALLKAGPDGLDTNSLCNVNGDAVRYLRGLRELSGPWSRAIKMAGRAYGRYAIVHE